MIAAADKRMGLIALSVLFWDQASKYLIRRVFSGNDERVVFDGFFKLVHWRNTGAAWSFFHGHNLVLAGISICALGLLVWFRRHFDAGNLPGQIALGLILGGILGNLSDRLFIGYVVDFLRFYLYQRGGGEIGFPAFNIADSAICVGVGLLLLSSFRGETASAPAAGAGS
jgi:signal peptidase II